MGGGGKRAKERWRGTRWMLLARLQCKYIYFTYTYTCTRMYSVRVHGFRSFWLLLLSFSSSFTLLRVFYFLFLVIFLMHTKRAYSWAICISWTFTHACELYMPHRFLYLLCCLRCVCVCVRLATQNPKLLRVFRFVRCQFVCAYKTKAISQNKSPSFQFSRLFCPLLAPRLPSRTELIN